MKRPHSWLSAAWFVGPIALVPACYQTDPTSEVVVEAGADGVDGGADVTIGDEPSQVVVREAGAPTCEAGAIEACYSGPKATDSLGQCHAGVRVCPLDGGGWGGCAGEILPSAAEDCSTLEDDNCDGVANEGCPCTVGTAHPCYTGAAGTLNVGPCRAGTQTCGDAGLGACFNETVPVTETCNGIDDDCDGVIDEGACVCPPKSKTICYTGPVGTLGVGVCKGGIATCKDDGSGYGPCEAEIVPTPEACGNLDDEDCNGATNESGAGCVCTPGATRACYTGRAGTSGVGLCKPSTETCLPTGAAYDDCPGQVVPSFENCDDDADEDCDGTTAAPCHSFVWGFADATYSYAPVVRRAKNGDVIWARMFWPQPLVYVTEVRRLDPADGALKQVWTLPFASSIRIDPMGNVLLLGTCQGSLVVDGVTLNCGSGSHGFALLMDPSGTLRWSHTWAGDFNDGAFDEDGGVALTLYANGVDLGDGIRTGSTLARFAKDGTFQWSRALVGNLIFGMSANANQVIVPFNRSDIQHYEVHDATGLVRPHTWAEPVLGGSSAFDAVGGYWLKGYGLITRIDAAGNEMKADPRELFNLTALPSGGLLASFYDRLYRFDSNGQPIAASTLGRNNTITSVDSDGTSLYVTGMRTDPTASAKFRGGSIGAGETFIARLKMNE